MITSISPQQQSPQLSEAKLLELFKLLADATRLRVLLVLRDERELNVTQFCRELGQSQPAVSHHLKLLRDAGLIQQRRSGKHNFYSLTSNSDVGVVVARLFDIQFESTPVLAPN